VNAKLEGLRFHDLRYSAAGFMVQAGVPENTVREILGHKSLGMTLRYAHLAPDHQADAMNALDGVARLLPSRGISAVQV
jgi:integrase